MTITLLNLISTAVTNLVWWGGYKVKPTVFQSRCYLSMKRREEFESSEVVFSDFLQKDIYNNNWGNSRQQSK